MVYDEAGGAYGIEAQPGASATENVVYASADRHHRRRFGADHRNRLYDITGIGSTTSRIPANLGTIAITDNVIYSNGTGIVDSRYYSDTSLLIANNLIYANSAAAIQVIGQSGVSIVNNTIDQPTGDGIDMSATNSGTQSAEQYLRPGHRLGINVAADSENGFVSDYNMFYLPVRSTGAVGELGRRAARHARRLAGRQRRLTRTVSPATRCS